MKARLSLSFPYLCALFIIGVMVWGATRSTIRAIEEKADSPARLASHVDPVCKMEVGRGIETRLKGTSYYFCTEICRERFAENPGRYLTDTCLVCRAENIFTPVSEGAFEATWQGHTYWLCTETHRKAFREDPAGYFMHTMWGIPTWLYYSSIALVLLFSFALIERSESKKETRTQSAGAAEKADPPPHPSFDLFRFAILRRLFLHPKTRFFGRLPFVAAFVLVIAAGLFGNQIPSKNIAPLLTWTIWWGGLVILILYAGKAWCYVCPWDAMADWAEGMRLWGRKKDGLSLRIPWPRVIRNIWPATILFIGLTWIELGFGVTMNPRVTAWLGLAMLGLAFASALIFDRRSFCRYGCLVGRISGLYALFAPVEIRARDKALCRTCKTNSCYKGNAAGEECPTFEHLGRMDQNTYCISCMECVKSCEKQNVALRLRPWGTDLAQHHRPRSDEAYLALLVLSLTAFHGLTMTGAWRRVTGAIESALGVGEIVAFSVGMAGLMVAPGLLYALLVYLSRWMAGETETGYRAYFIRYAYALLPIALFYHLAHNSEHLFMEGQKILPLLSDPFGWEWDLLGTATWKAPPPIDLPTLWVIQVLFVMVGHVYSLVIARRTAGVLFSDPRTALRSQVPMLAAMILFSLMSLWLLKQPMEMRTSAM